MVRGAKRTRNFWSTFVIALAVAGAGLDALPALLILETAGREERQDDAFDDADDIVTVSWMESRTECRSRRVQPQTVPGLWAMSLIAPIGTRWATKPADGHDPPRRLPTLLCRWTC